MYCVTKLGEWLPHVRSGRRNLATTPSG
jgi:hypothetical protein